MFGIFAKLVKWLRFLPPRIHAESRCTVIYHVILRTRNSLTEIEPVFLGVCWYVRSWPTPSSTAAMSTQIAFFHAAAPPPTSTPRQIWTHRAASALRLVASTSVPVSNEEKRQVVYCDGEV